MSDRPESAEWKDAQDAPSDNPVTVHRPENPAVPAFARQPVVAHYINAAFRHDDIGMDIAYFFGIVTVDVGFLEFLPVNIDLPVLYQDMLAFQGYNTLYDVLPVALQEFRDPQYDDIPLAQGSKARGEALNDQYIIVIKGRDHGSSFNDGDPAQEQNDKKGQYYGNTDIQGPFKYFFCKFIFHFLQSPS